MHAWIGGGSCALAYLFSDDSLQNLHGLHVGIIISMFLILPSIGSLLSIRSSLFYSSLEWWLWFYFALSTRIFLVTTLLKLRYLFIYLHIWIQPLLNHVYVCRKMFKKTMAGNSYMVTSSVLLQDPCCYQSWLEVVHSLLPWLLWH